MAKITGKGKPTTPKLGVKKTHNRYECGGKIKK